MVKIANEWTNITLTKSGTSVVIQVTNEEHVLNKMLTKINVPQTKQLWGLGPNPTRILDLLRIEERLNVDGMLITDAVNNSSAKRDNLISIFKAGGVITMTYEGSSITGNMDKLSVKKDMFDGGEPNYEEVGYSVKFTFIKGDDMI